MSFIDLHFHSSYSDGTMSPAELVALAQKNNLTGLALTDHDTIEGVKEFLHECQHYKITGLAGLEISSNHGSQPIHILGYDFDLNNNSFRQAIKQLQATRITRNKKIVKKLNDLGITTSYDEICDIAQIGQVGRPHFGQYLINKRLVKNMAQAFDNYLKMGRRAYVERQSLSTQEAISMIKEANGLAILAHPCTIKGDENKLFKTLDDFVDMGLDGLEVFYPIHSKNLTSKLQTYCRTRKLAITGGSDFHGAVRPGTSIGGHKKNQRIPATILTDLLAHTKK